MKQTISELALMGAAPEFSHDLYVGRPNIGDRERLLERINDMLDRRWLTNAGRYVQEFELRLADLIGVRHCIAICNGTVALEIAIRALGMSGEVILPSLTFIATAHALQWQEIKPVFCDIDPATHNIDPARVEELITPRTSGIIGVQLWGRPADADALSEIAKRHGIKLLFDAAHALGCTYKGRTVGTLGDAEVFSFHATKLINTFEGGAITTNNDLLAERIRLMKNFGFAGIDNVAYIGTNGKMSEVSAAMGLTSLESLEAFIAANRRNYESYRRALADIPGVRLLTYDERERRNFQYIVVEINPKETGIERDVLVKLLHAENVIARRYFYPGCHRMEPYRSYQPHAGLLLPQTDAVAARTIVLPTGTAVTTEDIECICRILQLAVENADAINVQFGCVSDDG